MLVPKRVKIRGFRGFRTQQEFTFDQAATVLYGENGTCKSSTLNAIEWCLFGCACIGAQTGIRERVGWIVENRHLDPVDVQVELELENGAGTWQVSRSLARRGKRGAVERLDVVAPGGEVLAEKEAERALHHLVGVTFRDFLTTAYQHQEVIRSIVVDEPRERNDAIDRLLGLSWYRNLLDAVNDVGAAKKQKALRERFESFERQVQTALKTRKNDFDDLRQEAREAGVADDRQTLKSAVGQAETIRASLAELARESALAPKPLLTPGPVSDLPLFLAAGAQAIAGFRAELPAVKEQQGLFDRRRRLQELRTDLVHVRQARDVIGRSARELDVAHGGQQAVARNLEAVRQSVQGEQARLRRANGRAAFVREARAFLGNAETLASICPLCGQAVVDLGPALDREWEGELRASVEVIQARIVEAEEKQRKLEEAAARYAGLDRQASQAARAVERAHGEIAGFLGRTLNSVDDPLALLETDLKAVEESSRRLQGLIQQRGEQFAALEKQLNEIRHVHVILRAEEKLQALEAIQESAPFRALEQVRDEMACWVAELEMVRQAIAAASRLQAEGRLQAAEQAINKHFRELTRHPAVSGICLRLHKGTQQRNAYAITDAAGEDLVPILSQGDLNALALAIFLGLAQAEGSFGFLMLDDPSQSLGSDHKRQLVKVLNDVGSAKHLFIATMDHEFRTLLNDGLTRTKAEYGFHGWTQEGGPAVARR